MSGEVNRKQNAMPQMPRTKIRDSRNVIRWVATASLLLAAGCGKPAAVAGPPAPQVDVTPVVQKDVPITREWVANLDGFVNAQIQPQVSGYLLRQTYKEGSFVKKGQVLFVIDPMPTRAALEQTEGQLAQAKAQQVKAQQDVDRDRPLAEARAIPRSQLDADIQVLQAAQAVVQAQQAQVALARINLGFTKVRSLIDGVAGIANGQIGNLVGPSTVLTTVSQLDPIKVYFALGEGEYMKAAKSISQIALGLAAPSEPRKVQLVLSDGSIYPKSGKLYLADRQVDPQTGTIRIAAVFPNHEGFLRPGQFGRVRMQVEVLPNALLVPQAAVNEIQGTYQVAALGSENKAEFRSVKVGPRVGAEWVITDGLKAGEQVIVQGFQKVRPGGPVQPKPYQAPAGAN
ncbi:MAG TPA: efflux RND transporter periplasmic adaptor subunit [Terriglobales bacterium]|jgi:membrane fusion protein (multidrug efflux system)|nr:efflux RND transporter periplasmic adaptor subunit [Terriglobales bacterium]